MNICYYMVCDVDDEGFLWNDSVIVVLVGYFKKGFGCVFGVDVLLCYEGVLGFIVNGFLLVKD